MEIKIKKSLAKQIAVFLSVIMMTMMILPTYRFVNALAITTGDIITIDAAKSGNTFAGRIDYNFPTDFSSSNSVLTYDFSKIYAYQKDSNGEWHTTGRPALDFTNYALTGPMIIEGSHFNSEFATLIEQYEKDSNPQPLMDAGYPYTYSFGANGVVSLDYSAAFEEYEVNGESHTDFELLTGGDSSSFVTFTCNLNADAFYEAGGDYVLKFFTDVTDGRNPVVNMPVPDVVDREIEVKKECVNFDFNGGTVNYLISFTNESDSAITTPIVIKDTLDKGLAWTDDIAYNASYVTVSGDSSDAQIMNFSVNNLPSGATTEISYSCTFTEYFYTHDSNHSYNNVGNTITGTTIPEGGSAPKPVILNEAGDTSIRVIPPVFSEQHKEYMAMRKNGTYSEATGTYNWTVLINGGSLRMNLANLVFTDNMDVRNMLDNYEVVNSTIVITNAEDSSKSREITGVTVASMKNPGIVIDPSWFTGPDSIGAPDDSYIISYSTRGEANYIRQDGVDTQVFHNSSYLRRESSTGPIVGYAYTKVVGPTDPGILVIEKVADSANVTYDEQGVNTVVNIPWIISVYIPDTFTHSLVLRDDLTQNSSLFFDTTLMSEDAPEVFYIENGVEVAVDATFTSIKNNDGAARYYTVSIDKTELPELVGKTIYWRVYTTGTVATADLSAGLIFHNSGRANNIYDDASFDTHGPVHLMNKHNISRSFDYDTCLTDWELVFNYDNRGNSLEAYNWNSIHVTDNLNGMEFADYEFLDYQQKMPAGGDYVWVSINDQDGDFYYASASVSGDVLSIDIDQDHPLIDKRGNQHQLSDLITDGQRIVIRYRTHVPTSAFPTTSPGFITNTATVTGDDGVNTLSQTPVTASIPVEYPIIEKEPISNVHNYNLLDYAISVNPYSLNLSRDNSNSYYVVDTLGDNIDYVIDSLRVYEKQPGSTSMGYETGDTLYTLDNINDNNVVAGTYEFAIDGRDLIIRVPDGVCLNISYTVRLSFPNSATVTNTAYLPITLPSTSDQFAGSTSTSGDFAVANASAGSTVNYALFYVDKVGEDNISSFLGGVAFILDEYNENGIKTGNTFTGVTNSIAALSADAFTNTNSSSSVVHPRRGYIYVLSEDSNVVAPGGYTVSDQQEAFYVPFNSTHAINTANAEIALGMTIQRVTEGKHFIFVNDVNSIAIHKTFDVEGGDVSEVTFTISGTNGTSYASREIEGVDGIYTICNLPIGDYKIVESHGATGYDRITGEIVVKVNSDKTITITTIDGVTVLENTNNTLDVKIEVMNNHHVDPVTGSVIVYVIDKDPSHNNVPVSGATVTINDTEYVTDKDGKIVVSNLVLGTDCNAVLTVPNGAIATDGITTSPEGSLVAAEEAPSYTFYVEHRGSVEVYVIDNDSIHNNVPVSGATVTINDTEYVTDEDGKIVVSNLVLGTDCNAVLTVPNGAIATDGITTSPEGSLVAAEEAPSYTFYIKHVLTNVDAETTDILPEEVPSVSETPTVNPAPEVTPEPTATPAPTTDVGTVGTGESMSFTCLLALVLIGLSCLIFVERRNEEIKAKKYSVRKPNL